MIDDKEVLMWIRRKLEILGLKSETNSEIQGSMHILGADHHGMKTYMRAYKCEKTQGVIANLYAGLCLASERLDLCGPYSGDMRKILADADAILNASDDEAETK
jgi:hypothetical protein